jgi:NAD(P)H dehydrogenase (quinone)
VLVIYYSKTGNTRKMADLVVEGAKSVSGTDVELIEAPDVDGGKFAAADGFAFGTPDYYTYMAGQLKIVFDESLAFKEKIKGKPYVSFVSHGGGGGAIKSVDELAGSIGLEKVRDGILAKGAPEGDGRDECRGLGVALAQAAGRK